jgi:hypothetical protein
MEVVMSEIRELIDTEIDAVCGGGGFPIIDSFNWVNQANNAYQAAAAVGGSSFFGNGGNAAVAQWLNQANQSVI